MTSERDHDDADDFPTPVPGPRRNPKRRILLTIGVLASVTVILLARPLGCVWQRAVGNGH